MTVTASCLDQAALKKLLERGAGSDEIDRVAKHLEICARCGETVESLLAGDPTAAALRGNKIAADEPPVQLLRARLAKLRPAPYSHETTAGDNTQGAASPPSVEAAIDKSASLAPPQQPDEIGRLGGYRLLAELGRGGMGVVYKAEDLKLKRLVALKVMAPSLAADLPSRQRFLREAVAMAAVHHDNIVVIHTVDEDNGVPFLAMEFLQGTPLDKWLKGGRKATPTQALKLGREIAEGLAAAHERGLIHRDIKPGNIWLDSAHKGRVKILDFGLARSGREDVHLTQSGAIVGTPAYMSPEQARSEKIDGRSDLFSLGCVLYRLCTGAMPFAGDTTMSLLMSLAIDHPKPVRELNPDVPVALSDLVMRLLAKKPEERPQSAREVVQAIQAISRVLVSSPASDGRTAEIISTVGTKPAGMNPAVRTETFVALQRPVPASGGKKRRPLVVAVVAAGFLATAIVAAIVIIVRDKNGNKLAEIDAPAGSTVTIATDEKGDGVGATKPTVDEAWTKQVAAMPAEKQVEAVAAKLKELNPGFDGKVTPAVENSAVAGLEFIVDNVTDISPVRALKKLQTLRCTGSGFYKGRLADLSPLKGMPLANLVIDGTQASDLSPLKDAPITILSCNYTKVSSLAPLAGAPLTVLTCQGTQVSDLSPLMGMKLTHLWCGFTKVSDLAPLKDMPLTNLSCGETKVSDLSPLKGMALEDFTCFGTQVSDLSPLKGMPLKVFGCDFKTERDAKILRSIKTLVTINGRPAAEFWKEVDARAIPPVDDAWVKQVADMPAEKQVEAVAAKLKELNPGFDGKVTPGIEGGVVTSLSFFVDDVTDVSPLRAVKMLQRLQCSSSTYDKGRLADLSPLKGMPLKDLNFTGTKVYDLSPLEGMPLTGLHFYGTPVSDLTPLKGAPLVLLECSCTKVADLSPLKGMPLENLYCFATDVSDLSPLSGLPLKVMHCGGTRISDLSPLKGLPLAELICGDTKVADLTPLKNMKLVDLKVSRIMVSDLAPLKNMPLAVLACDGTKVVDLSPLNGMPLKQLYCDFNPERDITVLRSIKTLEAINGNPAADFWKEVDPRRTTDDVWLKQVAAMPAEKQVEAVAAKLKELNPGFDGKMTPSFWNGEVVRMEFTVDNVTDITPLRALRGMRELICPGSNYGKGRLADLSPLKDMKLTTLNVNSTQVSNLSPLKGMPLALLFCADTKVSDLSALTGMPLTGLSCIFTPVSDLSPLKDMQLIWLWCHGTKVSDLSPLKGMPLVNLSCSRTKVSDLSPLKGTPMADLSVDGTRISDLSPLTGMKLTRLDCSDTQVSELLPLNGMPLTYLGCSSTRVADLSLLKGMPLTVLRCENMSFLTDISPLKGLPLKELYCDFKPNRDADILRSIKTLEKINDKPAAEFWKELDAKK